MSVRHASIIPLIGGMALGSELAFGNPPAYLLSYKAFGANEKHLVNYYEYRNKHVPHLLLDDDNTHWSSKIDVVDSTCPCAGLSQMSAGFGDHNPNNQWMPRVASYVLGRIRPEVYWGENAPGFAGKIGKTFREELRKIGQDNGYSMSVYRTRSLLHGLCQVRERSFYFFWRGEHAPLLQYYARPYQKVEATILSAAGNSQREPINRKTPSRDDPYYRFVLEKVHGGIDHKEFCEIVEPSSAARGCDILTYIERRGYNYRTDVAPWMQANGLEREVPKCYYRQDKLDAGGNVMRRGTVIPKDFIGAFVGHYPTMLCHPVEDRYINYREAMHIMGLPADFELLDPQKSVNHICQNVPVTTARDMASQVALHLENRLEKVKLHPGQILFQTNHNKTWRVEGDDDQPTVEDFFV